jgi:cytidine deaminase
MTVVSDDELCRAAEAALHPQDLGDFRVADVACALVSHDGRVFTGACVGGYLGLCAEQSAVSAMVSAGQVRVSRLVAVWRDTHGDLHALPPCGRCRELLRLLSQDNLAAAVILGPDHVVTLADLLPWPGWHAEPLRPSRRSEPEG